MRPSQLFFVLLLLQVHFTVQETVSSSKKLSGFFEKGHYVTKRQANCQCGIRKPSFGIINGQRTISGEYPWMAALQAEDGTHICGGTIIHEDWILTANHCPVSEGGNVIVGTNNLRRSRHRQIRTIQRVIKFCPDFFLCVSDDVRLVQVDNSFEFNDYVHPICLPFNLEEELFENERVEASGWGRFIRRASVASPILYKLDQTVISNSECADRMPNDVEETHICSDAGNVNGMCFGDSGGPLVYEVEPNHFTIVGVASFVESRQCDKATAWARVTSFLDWIVDNTGIDDFCKPF